ncbi:ESX secretion-associated protein EspG [Nocardia sp. NPDC049220]|uniref:ESX secretion-associated protein EspG n=1 Tax=Nocardia sp. NPDC049220 TaxID=3155273 RepID=UPI00340B1583
MSGFWRLTDIEFVVLWEELKEGGMPSPFVFTAATPYYDDYLREKYEVRERLPTTLAAEMGDVLQAVARPDIRVLAHGRDARDPDDPSGIVRLLGVRRGGQGYLLTQLPGKTVWHSGGFTVAECDVLSLADTLVAALPEVAAGRLGEISLAPQDGQHQQMDYSFRRLVAHELSEDAAEYRSAKFLRSTPARAGMIEICQGSSRFGPRGVVRRGFGWRDLVDDGRYAITGDNPLVARGVDTKGLIALINAEIAEVVRAIKDEQV